MASAAAGSTTHSTETRDEVLDGIREGKIDVVVGVNLLREGIDQPKISLVAILDADKPGFLRSATSIIQTVGRGAERQCQGDPVCQHRHRRDDPSDRRNPTLT